MGLSSIPYSLYLHCFGPATAHSYFFSHHTLPMGLLLTISLFPGSFEPICFFKAHLLISWTCDPLILPLGLNGFCSLSFANFFVLLGWASFLTFGFHKKKTLNTAQFKNNNNNNNNNKLFNLWVQPIPCRLGRTYVMDWIELNFFLSIMIGWVKKSLQLNPSHPNPTIHTPAQVTRTKVCNLSYETQKKSQRIRNPPTWSKRHSSGTSSPFPPLLYDCSTRPEPVLSPRASS